MFMRSHPGNLLSKSILLVLIHMIMPSAYALANICCTKLMAPPDSAMTSAGSPSVRNSNEREIPARAAKQKESERFSGQGTMRHPDLKLSLGFGFPELVYAGVQGYRNTFQFGAGAGTLPGYNHSIFSAFVQGGYHFGGKARYNLIPPWYTKALLCYGYEKGSTATWYTVFVSPRIGRNMYFGNKAGLDIEIGVSAEIWKKKVERFPSNWNFDFDFPVVPTISFGFFYLTGK